MTQFDTDIRVLIAPGLGNSGPDHWQTRWQQLHPSFERVEQDDWDTPDLQAWSARLDQTLRHSPRPTLIVAHSFGCLATAHRASRGTPDVLGALLVAPPDPAKLGLEHMTPGVVLPFPSVVIASMDDPWMEFSRAQHWSTQWGSEFINAGQLGHINSASNLGDWQFGLSQLQRLLCPDRIRH